MTRRFRAPAPTVFAACAVLLGLTGMLAACGDDDDTAGPEGSGVPTQAVPELLRTGGCGDVFFWGVSADDTVGLTILSSSPMLDIAGGAVSQSFELPSPDLTVTVEYGRSLSQPYCNDVIDQNHAIVRSESAVGGTVDIDIDPGSCPATGTATLTGVVVGPDELTVPDQVFHGEGLGCFAG